MTEAGTSILESLEKGERELQSEEIQEDLGRKFADIVGTGS